MLRTLKKFKNLNDATATIYNIIFTAVTFILIIMLEGFLRIILKYTLSF